MAEPKERRRAPQNNKSTKSAEQGSIMLPACQQMSKRWNPFVQPCEPGLDSSLERPASGCTMGIFPCYCCALPLHRLGAVASLGLHQLLTWWRVPLTTCSPPSRAFGGGVVPLSSIFNHISIQLGKMEQNWADQQDANGRQGARRILSQPMMMRSVLVRICKFQ